MGKAEHEDVLDITKGMYERVGVYELVGHYFF